MKKVIHSNQAPKAIGPYSQAVSVTSGQMLFLSGQIPLDAATGEIVSYDISLQTQKVMENLGAVLKAAGLDYSHVVRCGIFLTDLNDFAKVNEVYARFFPTEPPARATVEVSALPRGARVEIDAIAVSP